MTIGKDISSPGYSLTLLGSPLFNARAAQMKKNFVVIMLRGGMDGLTAIQPNDRRMERSRPDIMVKGVKKLTSDFNIIPGLKRFILLEGRQSVSCSCYIPYPGRSHFDGPNLMESGGHLCRQNGWLGRGIEAAELEGLAGSLPMPLVLRSSAYDNYYPTYMSMPDDKDLDIQSSYTGLAAGQCHGEGPGPPSR